MKLFFYINRTVANTIILLIVVFLGILAIVNFLGEMSDLGKNYAFVQAIQYVLFYLPISLYQLFPTVILLGILIGLGTLASHNELTVMRAAGVASARIAIWVLSASFLLILIMSFIGEDWAPKLATYAENQRLIAQSGGQAVQTQRGVWLRDGSNFYTIHEVTADKKLIGITRYEFNDHYELLSASKAQSAQLVGDNWVFSNVVVSHLNAISVDLEKLPQVVWPLHFNFRVLSAPNPLNMTLVQLDEQINYEKRNGLNTQSEELVFWLRVFQPLSTLVMALVAIPFIFGPLRNVGMGLRLLSGIMVGLVFFIANKFLGPFSLVYQVPPLIAALITPVLFFCFALFLFWRKK
ncbi:MAG: LPS export ABC transporter permease LptG [Gammaproteobacteria bacterium]|nr:LPS export ABC transporter permease LptG [Gammaproteobacteria bacterium]